MTVAELIRHLQTLPQDLPVHINDEARGNYYQDITAVFDIAEYMHPVEPAVIIAVNN